jgi:hypothetical protein
MSRIEKANDKYMVAFGADHATGSYLQVWHQPYELEDGAFLRIDANGVAFDDDQPISIEDILGESAWRYLEGIKARYQLARRGGNTRPNLDAETMSIFLTKLGFEGLGKEIRAALD